MSTYVYKSKDSELAALARSLESRVGDSSGQPESDLWQMLEFLMAVKSDGTLLDIGTGLGRIPMNYPESVAEMVAIEPDEDRWSQSHRAFHNPPRCQVLHDTTTSYMNRNPDRVFDLTVLSMVLQHVSTTTTAQLLRDMASLTKPDGFGIISSTHSPEATRGYSYARPREDEVYLTKESYDRYADNINAQDRGIPVRRFSRAEFEEALSADFDILYWHQTSYPKPPLTRIMSKRFGVPDDVLADVGVTQFAVVRPKSGR